MDAVPECMPIATVNDFPEVVIIGEPVVFTFRIIRGYSITTRLTVCVCNEKECLVDPESYEYIVWHSLESADSPMTPVFSYRLTWHTAGLYVLAFWKVDLEVAASETISPLQTRVVKVVENNWCFRSIREFTGVDGSEFYIGLTEKDGKQQYAIKVDALEGLQDDANVSFTWRTEDQLKSFFDEFSKHLPDPHLQALLRNHPNYWQISGAFELYILYLEIRASSLETQTRFLQNLVHLASRFPCSVGDLNITLEDILQKFHESIKSRKILKGCFKNIQKMNHKISLLSTVFQISGGNCTVRNQDCCNHEKPRKNLRLLLNIIGINKRHCLLRPIDLNNTIEILSQTPAFGYIRPDKHFVLESKAVLRVRNLFDVPESVATLDLPLEFLNSIPSIQLSYLDNGLSCWGSPVCSAERILLFFSLYAKYPSEALANFAKTSEGEKHLYTNPLSKLASSTIPDILIMSLIVLLCHQGMFQHHKFGNQNRQWRNLIPRFESIISGSHDKHSAEILHIMLDSAARVLDLSEQCQQLIDNCQTRKQFGECINRDDADAYWRCKVQSNPT